jgi:hypothetical protein
MCVSGDGEGGHLHVRPLPDHRQVLRRKRRRRRRRHRDALAAAHRLPELREVGVDAVPRLRLRHHLPQQKRQRPHVHRLRQLGAHHLQAGARVRRRVCALERARARVIATAPARIACVHAQSSTMREPLCACAQPRTIARVRTQSSTCCVSHGRTRVHRVEYLLCNICMHVHSRVPNAHCMNVHGQSVKHLLRRHVRRRAQDGGRPQRPRPLREEALPGAGRTWHERWGIYEWLGRILSTC